MRSRPLRRILKPLRHPYSVPSQTKRTTFIRHSSSIPPIPRIQMPSLRKFANDQIFIDTLRLRCVCGPDAFGRSKAQPVLLSVNLVTSVARAAASDRVDLSVDYSILGKQLVSFENETFESVVDLINRVVGVTCKTQGVEKMSVVVNLEKGMLLAKNLKWEKTAFVEDHSSNEWKLCVEGIRIPVIIGIRGNVHERTHKQLVEIDLAWEFAEKEASDFALLDLKSAINLIAKAVSETSFESLESLATLITSQTVDVFPHTVTVTVKKPSANPFASTVGVKITRPYQPKDSEEGTDVYIALGSNLGDRIGVFERALKLLETSGIHVSDISGLYESEPMYVQDQPQFLNAVCKARTNLAPFDLLATLKRIESDLGRLPSIRNGPRAIDLDILLFGQLLITHDNLLIPHASMLERGFVLQPLTDIAPNLIHPTTLQPIHSHLEALPPPTQHNFLPLRSTNLTFDTFHHRKPTLIMAILNLTPDSFSDGGQHALDPENIVRTVRQMIDSGAHIIDIGGQSTRPNADEVTPEEEIHRVIPAIQAIRQAGIRIPVSIDTYRARIAEEAIHAGADLVNDVSAGTLDPEMFSTVAAMNVPIILMHMRGTPKTMNSLANYDHDLVKTVGQELASRVKKAINAGIRRWNIILDPGLGFAKNNEHNVEILRRLRELRSQDGLGGMPWLLGPSRKRFIGKVTGVDPARERVWGTAGSVAACVQGGADIVRVHDVEEMVKVVKMCDAVWRRVQN